MHGSLLALLSAIAVASGAGIIDNLPFLGFTVEYDVRRGYLSFRDDRVQEEGKSDLLATGVMLGKRWRITRGVRLQLSAVIRYGSVADDTLAPIVLDNSAFLPTLLRTTLFHGGCIADVQYPIAVSPDGSWFLHAGGGAHLVKVSESESILGNTSQRVIDPYLEERRMYGASGHGGLGFEVTATPRVGFAIVYSLRYWYPVRYGMVRDYFPYAPIEYRERFFSHEFDVLLLVKRY